MNSVVCSGAQDVCQQIAKQQRINMKLNELLSNFKDKNLPNQHKHSRINVQHQNSTQLQIAQLNNIKKKIQNYKAEINRISQKNTPTIIIQIKALKTSISQHQKILENINTQLNIEEGFVPLLEKIEFGKIRNRSIQKMYNQNKYQIQALRRKFSILEQDERLMKFKTTKKLRNISQQQQITQRTNIDSKNATLQRNNKEKEKEEKKDGVDKFALYKNLIKFYTIQGEKLRNQISALQKQASSKAYFQANIQQQIEEYQIKIEELKKQGTLNTISLLK